MRWSGIDRNVKYLFLVLGIIVVAGAYHNYTVDETTYPSFGMCDSSIHCHGASISGVCLGVESPHVSCVNPDTAPAWRRAEMECGLDAQGLCNADPSLTGTHWTSNPNATWDGKRCTQWAQENNNFTLLSCDQTFNDITQWSGANQ